MYTILLCAENVYVSVSLSGIDICGLHVIRFLESRPLLLVLLPVKIFATPATHTHSCHRVSSARLTANQFSRWILISLLSPRQSSALSSASCVCVCVSALLMLFRHFQLFVCTTYGSKMLPQRTHVSVAPDIPDQLSCSRPSHISLALLVCKSLCSRNGSRINIPSIYHTHPPPPPPTYTHACPSWVIPQKIQFACNFNVFRKIFSSAA